MPTANYLQGSPVDRPRHRNTITLFAIIIAGVGGWEMVQYPFLAESLEISPFVDEIARTKNPRYARLENYCFFQGMLHFGIAAAMLAITAYARVGNGGKSSAQHAEGAG